MNSPVTQSLKEGHADTWLTLPWQVSLMAPSRACMYLTGGHYGTRHPCPIHSPVIGGKQSLTQRCHAHMASSCKMCHDQRHQKTLPYKAPLCPLWDNACWSVSEKALFGKQQCLPCSWGLWSVVRGAKGTWFCLTTASLLPARGMQYFYWKMPPKSR